MALTRITITLPADLVRAADKAAKAQDRSRSWVVADALKQRLVARAFRVSEVTVAPYAAEFEAARVQHLAADLKLSPTERLQRLEGMGELTPGTRRRGPRQQVIAFDSYDEFYAWKTTRRIAG